MRHSTYKQMHKTLIIKFIKILSQLLHNYMQIVKCDNIYMSFLKKRCRLKKKSLIN